MAIAAENFVVGVRILLTQINDPSYLYSMSLIKLSVSSSFYRISCYAGSICIRKGCIMLGLRMPKKCYFKFHLFLLSSNIRTSSRIFYGR
jgi:hypothetical protein